MMILEIGKIYRTALLIFCTLNYVEQKIDLLNFL